MPHTDSKTSKLVEFITLVKEYGIEAVFLLMLALARSGRDIERLMGTLPENRRLLPHHIQLMRLAFRDMNGTAESSGVLEPMATALMLASVPKPNMGRYYRNALDEGRDKAPRLEKGSGECDSVTTHLEREEAADIGRGLHPRQLIFDAVMGGVECFVRMMVRHRSGLEGAYKSGPADAHVRIFIADQLLTEPVARALYSKVIKPTKPFTDSRRHHVCNMHLEFGYLLPLGGLLEHLELVSTTNPAYFCTGREQLARNLQAALQKIGVPIENVAVETRN